MNYNITKKLFTLAFALLMIFNLAWSQAQTSIDIALRHIEEKQEEWNLLENDISDLTVSRMYGTKHNKVTHIYFVQTHQNIEIYNAITGVHITPNGKAYSVNHRFIADVQSKINTTSPSITATEAVYHALAHLKIATDGNIIPLEATGTNEYLFDKGTFSNNDINVKLRYQPMADGQLKLAWDLAINPVTDLDYWSMRVDASTGEVIDQTNWTVKCNKAHIPHHKHDGVCASEIKEMETQPVKEVLKTQNEAAAMNNGTYNVFGQFIDGINISNESPIHGPQNLMVEPYDPLASPFGWHDTDGMPGPEYTITRGNNSHARLDSLGNGAGCCEPDGGTYLVFDFPYDPEKEPQEQVDLVITNLFYMVNTMHDFAYRFGFDEASGNFQLNNYGNGGIAGDPVIADAQDGSRNPTGASTNNATFGNAPDGQSPAISMFVWTSSGGRLLTANGPSVIAGMYDSEEAVFSPPIDSIGVTADVVIANDGTSKPTLACSPLLNDDLVGKIALIDRGECTFVNKVIHAQDAGAVGVIVCNFENNTIPMGGSNPDIEIPAVMIPFGDCQLLRSFANGNGLNVTLRLPSNNGPDLIDGDLDNGVIAHEYGHGISGRLVGIGCLGNAEQMGEGWSDFFTLVTSVQSENDLRDRGIGAFVSRQTSTGAGIRRFKYSPDMNISPITYDDVILFTGVHAVGEVWNNMLWDLYWALVDEHGFNLDPSDMTAGNNIAIQLVMDGLKFTPCSPGFVDGRDAILLADQVNNGGENQCLIWETFARRGLGFGADQGSSDSVGDGSESYETLPTCIQELKITKSASDLIDAGDEIEYTITVTNHKAATANSVVVTDEIPAGCTFVAGSASNNGSASGGMVSWNLGDLATGDEIILTYKALSDVNNPSIRQFYDDMENGPDNWASLDIDPADTQNDWAITDAFSNNGNNSYAVASIADESDQALLLFVPLVVSGNQPVLRFWHKYDTQAGVDGGFLEYSTDAAVTWNDLGSNFIRNGYRGPLNYGTFAIPFLEAYWGESDDFESTYVDLSSFAGQEVLLRWRFGTNQDQAVVTGDLGWFIDDVEIMDMVNYNSEACVTSEGGDMACVELANSGTIVNTGINTSAENIIDPSIKMLVYPNPTRSLLNVSINSERSENATLNLLSVDGRLINEVNLSLNEGTRHIPLDVSNLAAGFYFVKVTTSNGIAIEKVVIE